MDKTNEWNQSFIERNQPWKRCSWDSRADQYPEFSFHATGGSSLIAKLIEVSQSMFGGPQGLSHVDTRDVLSMSRRKGLRGSLLAFNLGAETAMLVLD